MTAERLSANDSMTRALRPSLWLLALTSVHHAYGALAFHTPWRWHVAPVAVVTAVALMLAASLGRRTEGRAARTATAAFALLDLLLPGVGIGLFEGLYNHVLKNVLFFGGATTRTMNMLFPPPTYEWPHDVVFEATGIAQGALGLLVLWRWYTLVRNGKRGDRPATALQEH